MLIQGANVNFSDKISIQDTLKSLITHNIVVNMREGLPSVSASDSLAAVALPVARANLLRQTLKHEDESCRDLGARTQLIHFNGEAGEIVVKHSNTSSNCEKKSDVQIVDEFMNSILKSVPHYRILRDPKWNTFGVGVAETEAQAATGCTHTVIATIIFGKSDEPAR